MISVTIEYFIKPGQKTQYETLADRIHPEVYRWMASSRWRAMRAVLNPASGCHCLYGVMKMPSEPGANILNMPESCSRQRKRFSRPTASLCRRVFPDYRFPPKNVDQRFADNASKAHCSIRLAVIGSLVC
ncbi:MAG: hypothetical protein Ct9H300mP14_16620 [Gammaproteobacteria bacterium]|nr:MAG: hypothetical protein Ct9H300mP14_16620 [Gammaproteobacteria bacterium]